VGEILAVGTFLLLVFMERRRPLRKKVEPKLKREARNLAVAGLGAVALQIAGAPVIRPLTRHVERRSWGLLRRVHLPRWLEVALALLLMDYTFYVWHVMTHRAPFLWRFHVVHHVDLDLDASTALRFHFGELVAGIPWAAAQVVLIGIVPSTYSLWQTAFLISILFHHSCVEIPIAWERRLSWLFVTPRMHGIHHSVVEEESNSNWSSGLNIWDRLHGTLRLNIPQAEVTIGVPAYRDPVVFSELVRLPFEEQPPAWVFADGTKPLPHSEAEPRTRLVSTPTSCRSVQ
jgi:sterol desaturase/sphingolipid hydroxylase (fatty acid hydroxylase superfamily)